MDQQSKLSQVHNNSHDCHTASFNWNTLSSDQTAQDKELLVDWTRQDQAPDQRQSLESKKTFRLQIKRGKKNKTKYNNKKKKQLEKAAEYKT